METCHEATGQNDGGDVESAFIKKSVLGVLCIVGSVVLFIWSARRLRKTGGSPNLSVDDTKERLAKRDLLAAAAEARREAKRTK